MRRLLLMSVAAGLVLAGCGGSETTGASSLDDVKVSSGSSPKVTVPKGFSVSSTATRVLEDGDGAKVAMGDSVKINYVAVNGRTGKQFDSSFTAGKPYTVGLTEGDILPGFIKGLVGRKIGTSVLVAIAPEDGFGDAREELDVMKDDTLVFLFDVVGKVPTEATGSPKKLPSDVPAIVLNDKSQPDGFAPDKKAQPVPAEATSYTAIQGDGAAVTADQTVSVNYVLQVYPGGGDVVDSSWRNGAVLTRPLSELVPCWQSQLVGKKLGSRIVLICPKNTAYAGTTSELKDDDLIFAIDLLDAY